LDHTLFLHNVLIQLARCDMLIAQPIGW